MDTLSVGQMRDNVALSRHHVEKQEGIIARLIGQGHLAQADTAKRLLVTMHDHLNLEVALLTRLEDKAGIATT